MAVTKRKVEVSDVSPLILELHARKLGMSVQDLLEALKQVEGKNTAEKLRKIYEQRRAQELKKVTLVAVGRIRGKKVVEVPNKPGKHRLRVLAVLPGEEPLEDRLQWITVFATQAVSGRILAAPFGSTIEGFLNYSEDYDSWTLSALRVSPPDTAVLDQLCEPAEAIDWSQVGVKDTVYMKIDPSKADVDPTIKETRDGDPVIRIAYPTNTGAVLDIWLYDVDALGLSDPWAEFKSLPALYVSATLRAVKNGVYTLRVQSIYVPKEVEQKTLADRMAEYFQKKGKSEASPRAIARALSVPEGDVIATAKQDSRFDYSEEDDLVVYKG